MVKDEETEEQVRGFAPIGSCKQMVAKSITIPKVAEIPIHFIRIFVTDIKMTEKKQK
jgi:hypothetical protein